MFSQIFQQLDVSGLCPLDIGRTIISFEAAPPLLLYSYIPAIILALVLSFIIFRKNKYDGPSKAFLVFSSCYSVWVINILLQWILVPNKLLYISWQLTVFFEISFYLSALYLLFSFCSQGIVKRKTRILFFIFLSLIVLLTPSLFNIKSYDSENCEGEIGILWYVVYAFEILIPIAILIYGLLHSQKPENIKRKKQIRMFSVALAIFLGFFSLSNIAGELFQVYSFNLFGPIGMLIFITFVTYLMVKYGAFNVKLFSVQVFVWGLLVVVGSEFFFVKEILNFVLVGIAFIAIIIFGRLLIISVKKEIQQKDKLQSLNTDLQSLLTQRESLVHLITHKVKASFTRSKYIFAEMVGGGFGEITPELKDMSQKGLDSDNEGIKTVDLVLNAFNLEKGIVKYEMAPLDFKAMVLDSAESRRAPAEEKGLKMELNIEEGDFIISGDAFWLKEVTNNLIENAVRYTKEGSITVSLTKKEGKLLFTVKDTGVGITEEDKKNLFTEGGRGKNSVKVNVDSTGYGLFSVKLVVEAHGGRVWAESEGENKGSTFLVELNLANK